MWENINGNVWTQTVWIDVSLPELKSKSFLITLVWFVWERVKKNVVHYLCLQIENFMDLLKKMHILLSSVFYLRKLFPYSQFDTNSCITKLYIIIHISLKISIIWLLKHLIRVLRWSRLIRSFKLSKITDLINLCCHIKLIIWPDSGH